MSSDETTITRHSSPAPEEEEWKPEMDDMPLNDASSERSSRVGPLPSALVRSAAVCRRFRRLVGEPGFVEHYRAAQHGKPPLLGFFVNTAGREPLFRSIMDAPNHVPPERFALRLDGDTEKGGNWYYHGCRHGRLLLVNWKSGLGCRQILVWEPTSNNLRRISPPPQLQADLKRVFFQGMVVCAAGDKDGAGHAHVHGAACHSAPFKLVLVGTDRFRAFAFVYSSDTGEWWGDAAAGTELAPLECISIGSRCVQIGSSLYWMVFGYDNGVLEFDLETQSMSVVEVPEYIHEDHDGLYPIALRDGTELGLIIMAGCRAQVWRPAADGDGDGVAGWAPAEAMCLDTMLSLEPAERVDPTKVLGFSQDDNALFVASCSRLFVVHLDSMACRQICGMDEFSVAPDSRQIYAVYPFAGFL